MRPYNLRVFTEIGVAVRSRESGDIAAHLGLHYATASQGLKQIKREK